MNEQWLAGVDVGGTSIKMAFVSRKGEMLHKWKIPTNNEEQGRYLIHDIVSSLQNALSQHGKSMSDVAGIGIGVPGPVDHGSGFIKQSVNIGWPDNYPVREKLELESGLPVFIENDANCAALGEFWKGSGGGARNLLLVTLGTGVGGGVIIDGKIVRGSGGSAGEIGHLTSIPEGGAPCNCGKQGCLETIASATGIVRLAKEKRQSKGEAAKITKLTEHRFTAKDVFDFARENDVLCLEVIDEVSLHLGIALANLGNALNPERILLGGGVSKAGDILLKNVQRYFERYAFPPVKQSTELGLASLGNDAGILGAAFLVKSALF